MAAVHQTAPLPALLIHYKKSRHDQFVSCGTGHPSWFAQTTLLAVICIRPLRELYREATRVGMCNTADAWHSRGSHDGRVKSVKLIRELPQLRVTIGARSDAQRWWRLVSLA